MVMPLCALFLGAGLAAASSAGAADNARSGATDLQSERAFRQSEFDAKVRQHEDARLPRSEGNPAAPFAGDDLDADLYDFHERQRRERLGVRGRQSQKQLMLKQLRELQTLELDAKMGKVFRPAAPPRR